VSVAPFEHVCRPKKKNKVFSLFLLFCLSYTPKRAIMSGSVGFKWIHLPLLTYIFKTKDLIKRTAILNSTYTPSGKQSLSTLDVSLRGCWDDPRRLVAYFNSLSSSLPPSVPLFSIISLVVGGILYINILVYAMQLYRLSPIASPCAQLYRNGKPRHESLSRMLVTLRYSYTKLRK